MAQHISEDGILHSHRRENLKSYKINFDINFERATLQKKFDVAMESAACEA
jgi:hypothetical protein